MDNIFTVFKEHKDFSRNTPWTVITTHFPCDSAVAPHYADTIEILMCDGLAGDIRIGGRCYKLSGKQVFYIPPGIVHSMNYIKNDGTLLNVKLSLEGFSEFIGLGQIIAADGKAIDSICFSPPCYFTLLPLVQGLSEGADIYSALSYAILIFRELSQYSDDAPEGKAQSFENSELYNIINWTSRHFTEKITIERIAEEVGYSKFYFCSKFRLATGITYLSYLNGVRISAACKLLKQKHSVAEAAELCGFSDVPYFIKLFKKIKGVTPKQYSIKQSH